MNCSRVMCLMVLLVGLGLASVASAQLSAADVVALQRQAQAEKWTFTVGENSATKYSLDQLCGYKRPADFKPRAGSVKFSPMTLPSAFDWRALGGTTPIRDQEGCGSCWAFGTAGSFECVIKIKDGLDVDLAEQWLVSCNQSGYGCGGGLECFEYFLNPGAPGVATDPCGDSGTVMEADFPYVAWDAPCDCPYPHPYYIDSWAYISTAWDVPPADDIKQAIMTYGPVNVAVGVNSAFQAYTGGIFGGMACQSGIINHQVVLVGWDDDYQGSGCGVWILRNSWNTGWGDDGYMYIEYGCSDVGYGACFCVYAGADDLNVDPAGGLSSSGTVGGPFSPASQTYTLTNNGGASLDWQAAKTQSWVDLSSPTSGTLDPGASTAVTVSINSAANGLIPGTYSDTVTFTNLTSGVTSMRFVNLEVTPPVFYSQPLDTDPGWVTEGEWAFGVPLGLCGDPTSGYMGTNVYGYNLAGCYPDNMPEYFLTTTAIDCSIYEGVTLRFWRWLGVESVSYDHARVQVSNDGVNWVDVWAHTGGSFSDTSWVQCQYDISAVADGEPTVHIRWGMGPTDSSVTYCGWNIDDIALLGSMTDPLQIVPSDGLVSSGYQGGPFAPDAQVYTLTNAGGAPLDWTATKVESFFDVTPASGSLEPGASVSVTVALNAVAPTLPPGGYGDTVVFTNVTSGIIQNRLVSLTVIPRPGEIAVTDSIPPTDDLAMPFGPVGVGKTRTEQITIGNLDPTYGLIISDVALGAMYEEDFNDGLAQDWQPDNPGYWSVVSGEYRAQAGMTGVVMQSMYTGANWGELAVQVTSRRDGDTYAAAALYARASADFNWASSTGSAYGVGIDATGYYWVGMYSNGTFYWFQGWTYSPYLNTGITPNIITLSISGSAISVCFNGSLAWSGVDSSISGPGFIVAGAYSGGGPEAIHYFDNVIVSDPLATTSALSDVQAWYNSQGQTEGTVLEAPQGFKTPEYPGGESLPIGVPGPHTLSSSFALVGVPSLPYTLAPGASLTFDVVYAPSQENEHQATVVIVTNDADEPEVAVALSGTAYIPVHITHTPLEDTTYLGPYDVNALITALMGLASADLKWSGDGGATFTTVTMAPLGGDQYAAQIPAQSIGAHICYYIECADTNGDVVTAPVDAPANLYCFEVRGIPHLEATPTALKFRLLPGAIGTQIVDLANTGTWPADWTVRDVAGLGLGVKAHVMTGPKPGKGQALIDWTKEHAPDTLLVRFQADPATGRRPSASAVASIHAAVGAQFAHRFKLIPVDVVRVPKGMDLQAVAAAYKQFGEVAYVEPNYEVHAIGIPNDPLFNQLWGMNNTGQTGGTPDADIDAPEAWDIATGSATVIVSSIDTGVDYTNAELAANMWTNEPELNGVPGVDDDGNWIVDDIYGARWNNGDGSPTSGDPMDGHGHGTHTSGTIGAAGNNGVGVAGVNWSVRIMALRFLDAGGSGWTADAISALEYAVAKGANLTSNSWGGGGYDQALKDAIDAAGAAGQLFVAAAGNGYMDTDITPNYPSCYDSPNIISVAASDHNDLKANFSNWGATTVDLAAPGVDILSSLPGNSYAAWSGTSMATPHVSGVAALLLSLAPGTDPLTVKQWILSSVDVLPQWAGMTLTGGRLNAANALALAGVSWLSEDPRSGTLPVGSSTPISVTADATGLANGFVDSATLLFSGGPEGPVTVAVDLVVTEYDFVVSPPEAFEADGPRGGPFVPESKTYTLMNVGADAIAWTATDDAPWLDLIPDPAAGTLLPDGTATVAVALNAMAAYMLPGVHVAHLTFTDTTHGVVLEREARLDVALPPPSRFYGEPLDSDPGWTAEDLWAFGVPQGQCGDPWTGHTGSNVYGFNLAGCYYDSMPEYFLTTAPINCAGYANVSLRFWRWLSVDSDTYDHARVQVSNDGANWVDVWAHTGDTIIDSSWVECVYDISAVADGQSAVYIHWGMGPTDGSVTYGGWDIDDIELRGSFVDALEVAPAEGLNSSGCQGGPFDPASKTYTVTNVGPVPVDWTAAASQGWLDVTPAAGTLASGATATVDVSVNATANGLVPGEYTDAVLFTNTTSGNSMSRGVKLDVMTAPPAPSLPNPSDGAVDVPPGTALSWSTGVTGSLSGQSVLIIWDEDNTHTQALRAALESAGMSVTLSDTNELGYDGTNPSPMGFDVVIHLNGTTYDAEMPVVGQNALVSFVENGGGFLSGEWNAFEISNGRMSAMRDLVLLDRTSGTEGSITVSDVPGMEDHPILANVPSSFTFVAGQNTGAIHPFDENPAVALMRDAGGNDAVAVRELGSGRVVTFHHASNYGNYDALSDPNVQQLYIDGVVWASSGGGGGCPTTYDVYFGTDPGNLALIQDDIWATRCYPGSLDYDTTYYWQVTAQNCCGTSVGPIWSFTTVVAPPVAAFEATPTEGCVPLDVQFTDLSTGNPTYWYWDFGDGGWSYDQNPLHTYSSSGIYSVYLYVQNAGGGSSTYQWNYIVARGVPVASFGASPTSGFIPLTVQFWDSSSGLPTSWTWDFGDGTSIGDQNPWHTYETAGTYTVTLTVSNNCGSDTLVQTDLVTAQSPPVLRVEVPSPVQMIMYPDQQSTLSPGFGIFNDGPPDSQLDYSVSVQYTGSQSESVLEAIDSIITRSRALDERVASEGASAILPGAPEMTALPLGQAAGVLTAAELGIPTDSSLNVAICAADDSFWTADVQVKLLGTSQFASVSAIYVNAVTPTLPELQAFDAVLVYGQYSYADPTALGDVMADYVDAGGGVVCAGGELAGESMLGRWATGGYVLMDRSTGYLVGPQLGLGTVYDPLHPIMTGVSSFDGGPYSLRPTATWVYSGVSVIAEWTDGRPLVAVSEALIAPRADLWMFPPSADVLAGLWNPATDGALLMANALTYVAGGGADWLSVEEPGSGSIPGGGGEDKDVTFNSADMTAGTYTANILVSSNDPAQPGGVSIPCALTVVLDDLLINPEAGFVSTGPEGGPFTPAVKTYTLTNFGASPLDWTAAATQSWLDVTPPSGTLAPGASITVDVSLNAGAEGLAGGLYADTVTFTNTTSAFTQQRGITLSIYAPPPGAFHWFAMDVDPGWMTEGQWQFGVPMGGGSYCADPVSGYTGSNVYGYNLAGDYTDYMPQYSLITTPMDCTGYENVSLSFWRWLGIENVAFDHATVEASNDGVNWTVVWQHAGGSFCDGAWVQCTYDISAIADNQPTVYVRWTMGPTDGSVVFPGWNIDDVALIGERMDDLRVTPLAGLSSSGHPGGPFTPSSVAYTLTNEGAAPLDWTAATTQPWAAVSQGSGTLNPGESATVDVLLTTDAEALPEGLHTGSATFTNVTSAFSQDRSISLEVYTSGEVRVDPESIEVTVPIGGTATAYFDVINDGDAELNFSLTTRETHRETLAAAGRSPVNEVLGSDDLIVLEYQFSKPSASKVDAYDLLTMNGLESYLRTGAPIVPVRPVTVLVPYGKQVGSVRVTAENVQGLPGEYWLAPAQQPYPLSYTGAVSATAPNPTIYGQAKAWPGEDYEEVAAQSKRGYGLYTLNLFPVQYAPADRAVSYAATMRVEIQLLDAGASSVLRPTDETRAQLVDSVDNPAALSTYPERVDLAVANGANQTVLAPGGPYEFVIITPAALEAAPGPYNFQALRDTRTSQGHPATIVTTEWIYANYSGTRPDGGTDNQTRIRNFLADAYATWGTQYVLLGGTHSTVPARHFWVYAAGETDQMPVDMYYGCVDPADCTFDYNANGMYGEPTDGVGGGDVDLAAELYVGRAPVEDATELANFVSKTLAYDSSYEDYLKLVSMLGEYLGFGGESEYAKPSMEEIRLGSSNHGYTTVGFENHTQPDIFDFDTSVNLYDMDYSWPASDLLALMNSGVHVFNHLGHSNQTYCAKLYTSDLAALSNTKYFFMYSQGCEPGWFDTPNCFAEVITSMSAGAYAAVMNARYGWGTFNSTDGPSQRFDRQFWDAVLDERYFELGRANQDSKEDNIWDINGECIRWCYYELNLFGDPIQAFRFSDTCDWFSVAPTTGTVAPGGGSETIEVTFTAGELTAGTYEGKVVVASNDRSTPVLELPSVRMIVQSDCLQVTPSTGASSSGPQYGPFAPESFEYTLTNTCPDPVEWTAGTAAAWLDVVPFGGTLAGGASAVVTVAINAAAASLLPGVYPDNVTFVNVTSGFTQARAVSLEVIAVPGEINVEDSIEPANDLAMPFGEVPVGGARTEQITVCNADPTFDLTVTGISLGPQGWFSEDFNDGLAQGWVEEVDEDWNVVASEYYAYAPSPPQDTFMYSLYAGAVFDDCRVQADMHLGESTPDYQFLVLRVTDTGNFYAVCIYGGVYSVLKVRDGDIIPLQDWSSSPYLNGPPAWNTVAVNAVGSYFQVYINGNLTWAGSDSEFSSGNIGLVGSTGPGHVSHHYFDNVSVTAPTVGGSLSEAQLWYNSQLGEISSASGQPQLWAAPWLSSVPGQLLTSGQALANEFRLANLPSVPVVVPPGNCFTFDVIFEPSSEGLRETTLRIESNDSDEPEVIVTLSGTGSANRPPEAHDDAYAVDEGAALNVMPPGVLENDSDPDGDTLSAHLLSGASHGVLVLNEDGSFAYTHDGSETTTDSFTYRAYDGDLYSEAATVAITVVPVNDLPVAQNQDGSTSEDLPVDLTLSYSDPDGPGPYTITIVTGPSHGALSGTGDTRTYTPDPDYYGPDVFTWTVNDGLGESNEAVFSITVTGVNDPPLAASQSEAVSEDTPLGLTLSYSDGDGPGPYAFTILSGPFHGTLTGSDANRTYTPDPDYYGPDSFTWTVNDGVDESNEATVSITVQAENDSPVASNDGYAVNPGGELNVPAPGVLANDTDVEDDALTAHVVAWPSHGSLALSEDGSFTYTHDGSETTADEFTYAAYDGVAYSEPATVTITILPQAANVVGTAIATGSGLFAGGSDGLYLAAGEASNDTKADLVVSRTQDGGSGQMALFQRSTAGVWNAGNVVLSAGDGIIEPCLGILKHNGARWIAYLMHDGAGGQLKASRLAGVNVMETSVIADTASGKMLPAIADADGDSKQEVYAAHETAPSALLRKYLYGSGVYTGTTVADTGQPEITWSAPVIGDFLATGGRSIAYDHGLYSLHAASYSGGAWSNVEMYSDVAPLGIRAAGNIDGVAGDDIVIVRGDELVLISGGTFEPTVIVSDLTEETTALACADLDGDGLDEVYGGGGGGGAYVYTPASGWTLIETVVGIAWHDAAPALWTNDLLEEVVFAGLDADGKLTIKTYAADADEDGLSDNRETRIGTDPDDPDTDNDGASDGDEVNLGTNPLDPTSYPALFTGQPWEYTYALSGSDVVITDTVPGRDGVRNLGSADVVRFANGVVYTHIIIGTEAADNLVGASANDIVFCFGGDDYARGYNGSDLIIGGAGADRLLGDNDNDIILGEDGADKLYTGNGDDTVFGGAGDDLVVLADPDGQRDRVYGGNGGETGGDKLLLPVQGYPAFSMTGCHEFEDFEGGNVDDYVDWSDATVSLSLRGNGGNDTLIGGSGNDLLFSGAGHDTLIGNGGDDLVTLADADDATDVIDGGEGLHDRLLLAAGYGTFTMTAPNGFEEFTGTADNDIIDWSSATVRVSIRGNGGVDTLLAGSANDDLVVLGGCDHGSETVSGGDGVNDMLFVECGSYHMEGSCGFEKFTGGPGPEYVDWSDATVPVVMRGNGGDDTLKGGSQADLITGGDGNDALYGGGGADVLYGDGGTNHLTGGGGNDSLRGGGADYAHYSANPVPPRYGVRDAGSYIVVTDTSGIDGVDIVRGCPLANIQGPYAP